ARRPQGRRGAHWMSQKPPSMRSPSEGSRNLQTYATTVNRPMIQVMHPRIRELLEYLDAQRAVLRDAFDAGPVELRDTPPAADCWSVANTIEHLAIVEQRIAALMTKKIEGARTEGAVADPETGEILPSLGLSRVLDRSRPATAPPAVCPTGVS